MKLPHAHWLVLVLTGALLSGTSTRTLAQDAAPAPSQKPKAPPTTETSLDLVPRVPPGENFLTDYLRREATSTAVEVNLARVVNVGWRQVELTPAQLTLKGAMAGAQMGLFLGAVGSTFGSMNEDTAWALVGALSAVGAILGGTVGQNSETFRTELRWDASASQR